MKLDKNDPALLRLADSPFLPILRERIATRAYFHGVSRTGQDWQRPESNWLQAEREEIALVASYLGCFPLGPGGFANARPLDFERNYARAAHFRHYFGATNARPVVHGPAIPRVCALCQKTAPEVSFRTVSHLISEGLGNRSIHSNEECDPCNQKYGRLLESELGSMLFAERALAKIPTKKGKTAKAKVGEGLGSIGGAALDAPLQVATVEGDSTVRIEFKGANKLTIHTPPASYKPISALRSFVKSIFLSLPRERRKELTSLQLREFVVGTTALTVNEVYRVFFPGNGLPYVDLTVWTAETRGGAIPDIVGSLVFRNYALVWFSPVAGQAEQPKPLFPTLLRSHLPPYEPTVTRLRFVSDDRVRSQGGAIDLAFKFSSLVYAKDPIAAVMRAGPDKSVIDITLTTPESNQSDPNGLRIYRISAAERRFEVELTIADGAVSWESTFKLVDASVSQVSELARVAANMYHGFELVDLGDSDCLLAVHPDSSSVIVPAFVSDTVTLANMLDVLEKHLGVVFQWPERISNADRRAVELAFGAITVGVVKEAGPGTGSLEIAMPKQMAADLLRRQQDGPVDLEAPNEVDDDVVFGQTLALGPRILVIKAAALDEVDAGAWTEVLASWPEGQTRPVKIRADAILHVFPRFVPAQGPSTQEPDSQ